MLERIGNKDLLVQNYTSSFDIKEFIQEYLVPKAFPDIPMNKLNLGFSSAGSIKGFINMSSHHVVFISFSEIYKS